MSSNFYECLRHETCGSVTKLVNFKQEKFLMDIAQEMLTTFNNDLDLVKKVITADESWVYGYDIQTKDQSLIINLTGLLLCLVICKVNYKNHKSMNHV